MAARRSGFDRVIAFDMGGTSTDVARWDGDFEYLFEHRVGDARLLAPALAIETVAAGGGSVCRFDGRSLRVGPESAGAAPGPACYGAGGPLTVTDLDLLLGRIEADRFQLPVQAAAAEEALEKVRDALEEQTGEAVEPEVLAEGFLRIADERMAAAIRRVSLRRGYDPADYPLLAFGGAGPQHACAVAALLGIRSVLVPADAGLLSAAGVGAALIERFAQRQVLQPLEEIEERIPGLLAGLAEEARSAVAAEGAAAAEVVIRRRVAAIRLAGQESTLELEWREGIALGTAFSEEYRRVYGYDPPPRSLELESLRAVASVRTPSEAAARAIEAFRTAPPLDSRQVRFAGAARDTGIHDRLRLRPGDRLDGPALVTERHSVTVVAPGWRLEVDAAAALLLRRGRDETTDPAPASTAVQLELFSHRLQAIARDMGELLKRTAMSVNIKERMDFSCAVLDADGRLVVNAPHIPVHLGALGLCVRRLMKELSFEVGDTVVTNHPAYGGSHLPDITAVTPVFLDGRRLGFVANRAHHAEVGGSRPGSMPPDARCLAEEGVVIPPMKLVRKGEPCWQAMERLLRQAVYPSRAPAENLADLEAAVAANRLGVLALEELARRHGADTVAAHMRDLTERAATVIGNAFERLDDGHHTAVERLDDGTRLQVAVSVTGRRARVDFSGTAGVHPGNLNATPAVVHGVVLYVLRLLVDETLPLNEGLLEAVELVIPEGLLNPRFPDDPRRAPAVVGGNVETSQRLVDLLLGALRLAACSQGTMNNLVFGDGGFGYYETVAGGAGAGPDFDGCDAVHTHMTNTRATDPELLEHRYPVRLERFAIRRGSGGAGRRRGGDGVIRELRFLRPVSLSLLGQHRTAGPYGMAGGEPGRPGRQRLERGSGETVELAGIDSCEAEAGDRLILETPGGGGWGPPEAGEM
jgi:5-oxoprolinase (ATP-hydrolysing)